MPSRTSRAACIAAIAAIACGTVQVAQVHAAEGGFLEMLFGVHPAPQPQAQAAAPLPGAFPQQAARSRHLGYGRHKLKTRYAALPVRIHVSERQTPLDMSAGPAAAFLKDETLRPGDIVVFKTGAQVFAGRTDRPHTMADFEPVRRSALLDGKTRKLLAAMTQPAGALPADEARRMVSRLRKTMPAPMEVAKSAEVRVISPWRTTP
ncbi:hypothetical protein [Methylobacterium sp. J-076]|uniref:hypothetical protein n=1 Tax=Methylobacterium sp. J-076 TaxID=2836655 RepID=UPI001FB935EC|nr:hypothetical protein [Methylobacterium sp. J-076]MCJ2013939.1 hypothetical protein [Methylobacterium sp. J-076]